MQNFIEIRSRFLYKIYTFIGGAYIKSVSVVNITIHFHMLRVSTRGPLCVVFNADCNSLPHQLKKISIKLTFKQELKHQLF